MRARCEQVLDKVVVLFRRLSHLQVLVGDRLHPHQARYRLARRQAHAEPAQQIPVGERGDRRRLDGREQAERVHQRGVDLVGGLDALDPQFLGPRLHLEEQAPVDPHLARELAEPHQVGPGVREDVEAAGQGRIQPVLRPDHRVTEAVGRDRELHRHERLVPPAEEPEPRRVLGDGRAAPQVRQHLLKRFLLHDGGQEVVDHDPLVVPANEPLHRGEVRIPEPVRHAVVEAHEDRVKLRDDHVLVVPRIPDHRALRPRRRMAARQVPGVRILRISRQPAPEQHPDLIGGVEVRLVLGPPPVDGVKIEARRAKIDQRVRIVLLLEAARGIEREVVVDELAEVGEARADP